MAILLIISSHSTMNWNIDTAWERSITAAISGCTPLFVFISGVFFAILSKRYLYGDFMMKKAKRLLAPYLVVFTTYLVLFGSRRGTVGGLVDGELASVGSMAEDLVLGTVTYGTWYIPFAIAIFALSPLFIRLVGVKPSRLLLLSGLMLAVSSILHRSDYDTNTLWQNVVYFTPYYILGIAYAGQRAQVDAWVRQRAGYLVAAFFILTIALTDNGLAFVSLKTNPFAWNGFDPAVIQMPLMILAMLGICLKLDHRDLPGLRFIADISFGLYFFHSWVLKFLQSQRVFENMYGIEAWILSTIAVIALSTAMVALLKTLLGKRSHNFIGA